VEQESVEKETGAQETPKFQEPLPRKKEQGEIASAANELTVCKYRLKR
jgi:hypothetical protein